MVRKHLSTSRNATTTECGKAKSEVSKALVHIVPGPIPADRVQFYCPECVAVVGTGSKAQPSQAGGSGLEVFALEVIAAAKAMRGPGCFGEDRVFIAAVAAVLGVKDMADFKARLVLANQKRLLSLSRADMVELMDGDMVARSEIRHLGSTVHFVAL